METLIALKRQCLCIPFLKHIAEQDRARREDLANKEAQRQEKEAAAKELSELKVLLDQQLDGIPLEPVPIFAPTKIPASWLMASFYRTAIKKIRRDHTLSNIEEGELLYALHKDERLCITRAGPGQYKVQRQKFSIYAHTHSKETSSFTSKTVLDRLEERWDNLHKDGEGALRRSWYSVKHTAFRTNSIDTEKVYSREELVEAFIEYAADLMLCLYPDYEPDKPTPPGEN